MLKKPLIISGPTAVGKTAVALSIARELNLSIISVDSRQIYKDLKTGTACPNGVWKDNIFYADQVPYYLVDFLPINESFDVSRFISEAKKIFTLTQGQVIFVGGSGMYLQSYFCGMDKLPPANLEIRARLAREADILGRETLHKRLAKIDPITAKEIPFQNIHRLIRALEIYELTGKKPSSLKTGCLNKEISQEQATFIYLDMDRELLLKQIEKRTSLIFEPMVEEAKIALQNGYEETAFGLKSLGFPQAIKYLKNEITKDEALEQINILTRQYAKRQRTWFARYKNKFVVKINEKSNIESVKKDILLFINSK